MLLNYINFGRGGVVISLSGGNSLHYDVFKYHGNVTKGLEIFYRVEDQGLVRMRLGRALLIKNMINSR